MNDRSSSSPYHLMSFFDVPEAAAFAPVPVTATRSELPSGVKLLIGGAGRSPAWGLDEAQRRLGA